MTGTLLNDRILRRFVVVMVIALFLYAMILGIIYLASGDTERAMVPVPVLLLVFALAFIFTSMFFVDRGAVYPWSLIGGGVAALGVTFIFTAVFGGIQYIIDGKFAGLDWNISVYILALCIIVSVVMTTYIGERP